MGAPGNAGGGAIFTDTGGGGGANAGAGGDGGKFTNLTATASGGLGGASVPLNATERLFLGRPILLFQ